MKHNSPGWMSTLKVLPSLGKSKNDQIFISHRFEDIASSDELTFNN